MKRGYLVLVLLLILVIAGIWFFRRGGGESYVRLIDRFAAAEVRPAEAAQERFRIVNVSIGGDTKRAIFMHPTSRLTYKQVAIPNDAWLRVAVALQPEAWDKNGDGVLFRFGVSDGRTYDELFRQHVNPFGNPADRRWAMAEIDLSPYAGEQVDLIFNTNTSLPGQGDNATYDWAVWGEPEIVVRP